MKPKKAFFRNFSNDSLTTKDYKDYKEILSEVFQSSRTANIAICGGFGVGEFSSLLSFENDREIRN